MHRNIINVYILYIYIYIYYVCLTPFNIQAHIIKYSSVKSFILYLQF